MDKVSFSAELEAWIGDDPEREAWLIKEAPIAESTLRQTLKGRYLPAPRLEGWMRKAMAAFPTKVKQAVS